VAQDEWTSDTVYMKVKKKSGNKKRQDTQKQSRLKPSTKYDDIIQMEMASIDATVLKVQKYQEAVRKMEEETALKKTEGIGRRRLNPQFDRGIIAKLATREAHLDLERRRIEHHMDSFTKIIAMMNGKILHEKSICRTKSIPLKDQTRLWELDREKARFESELYDLQLKHKEGNQEKKVITKDLEEK